MVYDILKALLAGFVVAVPAGPILIMVIQKTLEGGRKFGLTVGLGSAIADTVFATAALFALSLVWDFIEANEKLILLVGGCVLVFVGLTMIFKVRNIESAPKANTSAHVSLTAQAALTALSNPGALAVMMALFAALGLQDTEVKAPLWCVPIAVFVGEICYWTCVTKLLVKFVKVKQSTINKLSRIAGALIIVLAAVFIVKGFNLI